MNDRLIILEALLLIEKGEDFGSRIIKDVLDKYAYLDRQHRSFIKRVLEGTLERRIEMDYIIDQFSKTPTAAMKPVILCILRMSVYQLKYMDQVPTSAVCNEAVKLAEKKGFYKLKGFVNGVLRNIARNLENIKYPELPCGDLSLVSPNAITEDLIRYFSIRYSMPEFLVEHFLKYYGPEGNAHDEENGRSLATVENIFKAFLRENITTIRPNRSKTTEEKLIKSLEEDGAKLIKIPDITFMEDIPVCGDEASKATIDLTAMSSMTKAYILTDFNHLTDLKAFKEGLFTVQDQSAMLPVALSGIKAGDTVMDVCAAPGGKTIQAIDELCKLRTESDASNDHDCVKNGDNNAGTVYSFDVSEYKTDIIKENLERCDFATNTGNSGNVEMIVEVRDARIFNEDYVNLADVLIADLPCSGLGIIGRKSDIKYNVTSEGMQSLTELQREILSNVVKYVKDGGTLMYSTCTLNPAENEEQVKWMEENLGLKCEEMHCILPSEYRDGFFVARMRKA